MTKITEVKHASSSLGGVVILAALSIDHARCMRQVQVSYSTVYIEKVPES